MDYRALLKKYLAYVGRTHEGEWPIPRDGDPAFTREEVWELTALDEENLDDADRPPLK